MSPKSSPPANASYPHYAYAQAAALIEQRTGLSTRRRGEMHDLLLELAAGDFPALVEGLRQHPLDAPVWQAVIRALAIGETYFFRDETHFHALRTQLLPAMIAERRRAHDLTLRLWSAGCATGEEPYSLAILLHTLLPDLARWSVTLLGTDLNVSALAAARRAVYRPWSFRGTHLMHGSGDGDATRDATRDARFFEAVEDGWQVKPHIRQMVRFGVCNLFEGVPEGIDRGFDLIFCRNVLLYFSPEQAVAAEAVLGDALLPGGWLFLGHSEALRGSRAGWELHRFPGSPIYQKPRHVPSPQTHNMLMPPAVAALDDGAPAHPSQVNVLSAYDEAVRAYHHAPAEQTQMLLHNLLQAQPDHARGWTLLAYLFADQQQPEAAHAHLDRALESDPLLADAHYLRALLYREAGEADAARQAVRAALYAQRDHALASYLLAGLHAERGEFERAVKYWETARDLTAGLPPAQPLSEYSEMTAGRLHALVNEHLAAWRG